VALLAGWERERRVSVTLDDIRRAVGGSVARDVASRLVAKKALERIGAGRYMVRPLRTLSRPTAASAPVQAAVLLQGEPYYLGGLWALTFHRLTEQQHVSLLDAFAARRHSSLLDFPALAGGGGEALRMVKQTLPRVDCAKLVEYAVRGARSSTCQRLGVLLERAGGAHRRLTNLHKRVLKTKSVLSMEPGTPRRGPFNRRWSVIENDR
jgi:predicted transcriptional regulator of viral defense system